MAQDSSALPDRVSVRLGGYFANMDTDVTVADPSDTLSGTITEVRFSNPHVRYRVDVTRPDGSVENWEIQAGSVTSLRPQGSRAPSSS